MDYYVLNYIPHIVDRKQQKTNCQKVNETPQDPVLQQRPQLSPKVNRKIYIYSEPVVNKYICIYSTPVVKKNINVYSTPGVKKKHLHI